MFKEWITVYLSGPMSGTKEESTKWRDEIKDVLNNYSYFLDITIEPGACYAPRCRFNILDPCARWFDDKKFLSDNSSWIVKLDKMEIDKADVLIVNANDNAWGTPMEQKMAWDDGKFVIAFSSKEYPSIWAKEHCHVMLWDHVEAARWLCSHSEDIARTL